MLGSSVVRISRMYSAKVFNINGSEDARKLAENILMFLASGEVFGASVQFKEDLIV